VLYSGGNAIFPVSALAKSTIYLMLIAFTTVTEFNVVSLIK
jgi:hypothetical protein